MAITYRRTIGTMIWHSTPACVFWPALDYEEEENPSTGQHCSFCIRIEAHNDPVLIDREKKPK